MVNFTSLFTLVAGESAEGVMVTSVGPLIYASPTTGTPSNTVVSFGIDINGFVVRNGVTDTASAVELYYHNHTVYRETSGGAWFYYDTVGVQWLATTSPQQGWSATQKGAGLSLSNNNLLATASLVTTNQTVYGAKTAPTGKFYWELIVTASDVTHVRVGVGTNNSATTSVSSVGIDTNSIGWLSTGAVNANNALAGTWNTFASGDRLSFALDMVNWKFYGRVNNGTWNNSGSANPATNVGGLPVPTVMQNQSVIPGVTLFNQTDAASGYFETNAWNFIAPVGFASYSSAINTAPAVVHYGAAPPPSILNVTGNQSPLGWSVGLFDDFTAFSQSTTDNTATTNSATWFQGLALGFYSQSQEIVVGTHVLTQAGIAGAATPYPSGRNPYNIRNGTILQMTAFAATSAEVTALQAIDAAYALAPVHVGADVPAILTGSLTSAIASPTSESDALTKGSFSYGYFEANLKMPTGANADPSGLWSGFLTSFTAAPNVPQMYAYQQDVPPTQIDSQFVFGTNPSVTSLLNGPFNNLDFTQAFHTFGLLWTPNYIALYIDGALAGSFVSATIPPPANGSATIPLESAGTFADSYFGPNSAMDIRLQYSAGWYWPFGHFVSASQLPATFEIDWVRYSLLGPA